MDTTDPIAQWTHVTSPSVGEPGVHRPLVLLVGDAAHPEFLDCIAWLGRNCRLLMTAGVREAVAALQCASDNPDVILFAQPRPGTFSEADVERLHRAAPLSRLVALLGPWCEGEARTGRPWPGVMRVYWHQFAPRAQQELLPRGQAGQGLWSLPRTMTPAELFLEATCQAVPHRRGLVAIQTGQLVQYEGLAESCLLAGYAAAWLAPGTAPAIHGVALTILDPGGYDRSWADRISRLAEQFRPAPLLVLLDFPRLSDYEAACTAGASAVLSKPFLLGDLLIEIERLAPPTARLAAA